MNDEKKDDNLIDRKDFFKISASKTLKTTLIGGIGLLGVQQQLHAGSTCPGMTYVSDATVTPTAFPDNSGTKPPEAGTWAPATVSPGTTPRPASTATPSTATPSTATPSTATPSTATPSTPTPTPTPQVCVWYRKSLSECLHKFISTYLLPPGTDYRISDDFGGDHPVSAYHTGLDISLPAGTLIKNPFYNNSAFENGFTSWWDTGTSIIDNVLQFDPNVNRVVPTGSITDIIKRKYNMMDMSWVAAGHFSYTYQRIMDQNISFRVFHMERNYMHSLGEYDYSTGDSLINTMVNVKSNAKRNNSFEYFGTVGNTGYSTGPHIHLEIKIGRRYISPAAFARAFLKYKECGINSLPEESEYRLNTDGVSID